MIQRNIWRPQTQLIPHRPMLRAVHGSFSGPQLNLSQTEHFPDPNMTAASEPPLSGQAALRWHSSRQRKHCGSLRHSVAQWEKPKQLKQQPRGSTGTRRRGTCLAGRRRQRDTTCVHPSTSGVGLGRWAPPRFETILITGTIGLTTYFITWEADLLCDMIAAL
jgi:hypothetical protein